MLGLGLVSPSIEVASPHMVRSGLSWAKVLLTRLFCQASVIV